MKGVEFMQQKVNAVSVMAGNEEKVFEDVMILKGAEGLYIETVEKIGTDNDGNDLTQNVLTMYPWEKVVSLSWKENTLIESVKQAVILEALQDLEGFLDDYDEEEDEESEINDDQEFIGGENTSNDKNDDENEDDENVVRNIEGLKLKSPYYFQDRMEKRDEVLFLKTDQGRFNSYSRTCHMNTRRQPVILNQRELDKINKEHPGFLKDEDIIKYGSNPDKKYYYI